MNKTGSLRCSGKYGTGGEKERRDDKRNDER
jgi:hypothetical protein